MLLIPCPYCGERTESEFSYGGEAHKARPDRPDQVSDEAWADYVFMDTNTKGTYFERWVHTYGCRRWFNLVRDTLTMEIHGSYKMGETPPKVDVKTYI